MIARLILAAAALPAMVIATTPAAAQTSAPRPSASASAKPAAPAAKPAAPAAPRPAVAPSPAPRPTAASAPPQEAGQLQLNTFLQVCQLREREIVLLNNQLLNRNSLAGREPDAQKRALVSPGPGWPPGWPSPARRWA